MFPETLRAVVGQGSKVAAPKRQAARRTASNHHAGAALARNSIDLTSHHRRQLVHDVLTAGGHMWVRGGGWSMHPTIKPGERVLLQPLNREPKPGDVVAFRMGTAILVHRVIDVSGPRLHTRGDGSLVCDKPILSSRVLAFAGAVERDGHVIALYPTLRYGVEALVRFGYHAIRRSFGRIRRNRWGAANTVSASSSRSPRGD
ncbi:MAG: S24 family peptidase [Gemmatimonadaceae bacterium]